MFQGLAGANPNGQPTPCPAGLEALEEAILSGGTPELFLWSREGDAYVLVSLNGDPKMVLLNDHNLP